MSHTFLVTSRFDKTRIKYICLVRGLDLLNPFEKYRLNCEGTKERERESEIKIATTDNPISRSVGLLTASPSNLVSPPSPPRPFRHLLFSLPLSSFIPSRLRGT